MKFWQWSFLIALVILGFVINLFDKKENLNVILSDTQQCQ